jgi:hypothetical protein
MPCLQNAVPHVLKKISIVLKRTDLCLASTLNSHLAKKSQIFCLQKSVIWGSLLKKSKEAKVRDVSLRSFCQATAIGCASICLAIFSTKLRARALWRKIRDASWQTATLRPNSSSSSSNRPIQAMAIKMKTFN